MDSGTDGKKSCKMMEVQYKKIDLDSQQFALRRCRDKLQKETLACDMLPYLYQERIISDQDKERIEREVTSFKQNGVLFDILAGKGPRLFKLLEVGFINSGQIHLMEMLKYTANSYSEETKKAEICIWLKDNYQEVKDHSILLDKLVETFEIDFRFTITEIKLVEEALQKTFPSCNITVTNAREVCKVIHHIAPTRGSYVIKAAVEENIPEDITTCSVFTKEMTEWNQKDVALWLKSFLKDDSDLAVGMFEQEKISGEVLVTLDRSDHGHCFKELPYGIFCKILMQRDKRLQNNDESSFNMDHLRPFGKNKTSYKANAQILSPVSNADTKCLVPVHYFVDLSDQTKHNRNINEMMACKTLQFANACMNSRVNGIVHFGFSVSDQVVGIQGISLTSFDLDKVIQEHIQECAFPDQIKLYNYCIGAPCYIAVSKKDNLYVVEVDVVPAANVCGDSAFYLLEAPKQCQIYGILAGKPHVFSQEQVAEYIENKDILHQQRDTTERKITKQYDRAYLKHRLVNMLCMGDDKMAADIYPVLVIDKPSHIERENKETFNFIKHMKWTAVFDFDAEGCIYHDLNDNEGQNYRLLCVEEFNQDCHNENLQEEWRKQPWIFSNGYAEIGKRPSSDIKEWTKERNNSFHSSLLYMHEQIPPGRAVFVFLRFGDSSITNEAACHFCKFFPEQFIILAQDDNHIQPLQDKLTTFVDKKVIERRSVVGIEWMHLKNIFCDITGHRKADQMQIPISTGARCTLNEKIINHWTDLDILFSNECDREPHIVEDVYVRQRKGMQVQENFYHGQQVTWWNFWFEDQVLRRSIHYDLRNMVTDALSGRNPAMEDSKVKCVTLYHQPGSGATTTAKNIIWELRTQYRCASISSITSETAIQLDEYRKYQDSNPKPILILLDNPDEEKTAVLTAWLEENAKMASGSTTGSGNHCTWYVFLICKRNSDPPQDPYGLHKMMKQELLPPEKSWFQEKYRQLEKIHRDNNGPDPKYLLSFNILKNDFNESQIKRTVQQLVKDTKDENERMLLKYVAFLNHFHIHHRYVPLSVFDQIMSVHSGTIFSFHRSQCYWETQLCHAVEIMLDRTLGDDYCHVHQIGIIHPLLSKQVLLVLRDEYSETFSDIALHLLKNRNIFTSSKGPHAILLKLVKDIFIMRERNPEGSPLTKFAPLIETIRREESQSVALEVFKQGYELTNSPFVAQQIARFHITQKDWDEASKYATIATEALPGNSFLWDTHAQVYREKLNTRFDSIEHEQEHLNVCTVVELIDIAEKAMDMFKQEQVVSDQETQNTIVNLAGYGGAIWTFINLMNCMRYFDRFYSMGKNQAKVTMWESIQSGKLCPSLALLKNETEEGGRNNIDIVKHLGECAKNSYLRLADENVQLRNRNQTDTSHSRSKKEHNDLANFKAELTPYFGDMGFMSKPGMKEEELCLYRRRLVFSLVGPSLHDILEFKEDPTKLRQVKEYMLDNIKTPYCNIFDYHSLISSVLILMAYGKDPGKDVTFGDLIKWSKTLYGRRKTSNFIMLEAYLYFVMFHWPRENIKVKGDAKQIKEALVSWREAYFKKFPRQAEARDLGKRINVYKKKETVMFFFSKREDLHSIALYRETLSQGLKIKMAGSKFWQDETTRQNLQRFRGVLSGNGCDVIIPLCIQCNKDGDKTETDYLRIPASRPVKNSSLFNKAVEFYLVFSWIGPKAYDVAAADATEAASYTEEKRAITPPEEIDLKAQRNREQTRHTGRRY